MGDDKDKYKKKGENTGKAMRDATEKTKSAFSGFKKGFKKDKDGK